MSITAPHICSLTPADLEWLAEGLPALPGGWTLQPVDDPHELSAVLLPVDGDRFAPTFLIDRVAGGIRLMACRWDEMHPVGVFPTLAEVLAAVADAAATGVRSAPFPHLQ